MLEHGMDDVVGVTVVLGNGFEKLELAPGQWKGTWEDLYKMRWRISNAGRVGLTADAETQTFTFSVRAF